MKKYFFGVAIAIASFFVCTSAVNVANATPTTNFRVQQAATTVPISGILAGVSSFAGNFDVQRFIVRQGQLFAVGNLTGTLTNLLSGATQAVNQIVQIPVTSAAGTCQILSLDLGPLNLDLLGLQVHLDRVVLNITAQSGPGKLLGNLLCAVANLLNNGNPLQSLVGQLNRILGQL